MPQCPSGFLHQLSRTKKYVIFYKPALQWIRRSLFLGPLLLYCKSSGCSHPCLMTPPISNPLIITPVSGQISSVEKWKQKKSDKYSRLLGNYSEAPAQKMGPGSRCVRMPSFRSRCVLMPVFHHLMGPALWNNRQPHCQNPYRDISK